MGEPCDISILVRHHDLSSLIANSPAANDAVLKKFLFELQVFAVATFKVKAGVPCREDTVQRAVSEKRGWHRFQIEMLCAPTRRAWQNDLRGDTFATSANRLSHQFPFPRLQPNITSPSQENLSGANLVLPQLSEVPTVDDPV